MPVGCNLMRKSVQVVVVDNDKPTHSRPLIKMVAEFYGITTCHHARPYSSDWNDLWCDVRHHSTIAVIITADALASVDQSQLMSCLRRAGGKNLPLLIVGVSTETPVDLLMTWTNGGVQRCIGPLQTNTHSFYKINDVKDVTRQLSGQSLVVTSDQVYTVSIDRLITRPIITLVSNSRETATFVVATTTKQKIFLSTLDTSITPVSCARSRDNVEWQFSTAAPLYIFIAYVASERAWHSNGHYANLTIDDPRLVEPYGHVHYRTLLHEMEQHNFHTTVAHIPWNFNRHKPEVIKLFKDHPDRFSVTVHGNNHDHQEFPSLQKRSLEIQTANLRQALARMDRFQSSTNLPYDRVMVFPHSIAPEATLGELKRHNYLATANSRNVPLGASEPDDPQFGLRPTTLAFAGFPTIRRYSAEIPIRSAELAVNVFLGNPVLFYIHQEYFAEGITRFNAIADTLNQLEPRTVWTGLGEIARNLYLQKLRDDGAYDVKAFTNQIRLENKTPRDRRFVVEKEENGAFHLELSVNGMRHPYHHDGQTIQVNLVVGAGKTSEIMIRYPDQVEGSVDISKGSLRVAGLRYLSEFRDNVVSRISSGRCLLENYKKLVRAHKDKTLDGSRTIRRNTVSS